MQLTEVTKEDLQLIQAAAKMEALQRAECHRSIY